MSFFYVFLGGGLGSVARFGLSKAFTVTSFPFGTFMANILACLILGLLMGYHAESILKDQQKLLLATGFCGGFSTFSTYVAELFDMYQEGQMGLFAFYFLSSMIVGLVAIGLGLFLSKSLMT